MLVLGISQDPKSPEQISRDWQTKDDTKRGAGEGLRGLVAAQGCFVKRGFHDYRTERSWDVKARVS